ncbi:hypothetical protein KVT40_007181 [Elsinoe batatas]|uniref:Uncharacterized protein n=1 Tax=Elsinoe batatas TaxID=2601811 RepID=A0A8K0KY71_9PEZI|nr:hypothetical protein KVT40_007181 [Elsinoe batatas]
MQVSCVWSLCSRGASSRLHINAPGPSHASRWPQNSQTLGVGEPAALPSKPPVALLRRGHGQPKYECHRISKVCS